MPAYVLAAQFSWLNSPFVGVKNDVGYGRVAGKLNRLLKMT
jgi:hypothetical protein